MTASENLNTKHEDQKVQALPGAFDLLFYAITLTKRYAHDVYGFAAYLLFPIILMLGTQHVSGMFGEVLTLVVNIIFILTLCWISATIIITASMRTTHPKKDPDPRSIGVYAVSILGTLTLAIFLSAFLQFAGYVLFIIPGILLSILLTFVAEEVVLHGSGPLSALAASRAKVQPFFLAITWRLIVLLLGTVGVYIIAGVIIMGLISFGTGIDPIVLTDNTPLWVDAILTVLQIAFLPPLILGHTILYLSLDSALEAQKAS